MVLNEVLGERYQVVSRLGTGAFGEVYRAKDGILGREVAVKRIRMDAFAEAGQLEEINKRFLREAQVASQLRHPNIVTTHDIVSAPTMSFIVMELVEGRTLSSLLKARGRLSLTETLEVLSQVASALDYAHQSHVVHRDIKPANIMIEPSGHVKVMDFGIAKLDSGANLTASGNIVGTPNYMSPEQARGERVDGRSDVFSLGCILYECLTGERAFKGESVTGVLMKVLTDEPGPIDFGAIGLPYELGGVLAHALEKRTAERFATCAELIDAVRAVTSLTPAASTMVGAARVDERPASPATVRSTPAHPEPAHAMSVSRLRPWVAAILLALTAGYLWSRGSLDDGTRPTSGAPAASAPLVVEREPGFLGKILGRPSQLVITVPADTSIPLVLETPLSSETARRGDEFVATLATSLSIEDIEALPA
ncbi:MAG: serine/threonine-protein kinase, partial [Vicinamibacteria bacterium]